jgi:hypothetical protein
MREHNRNLWGTYGNCGEQFGNMMKNLDEKYGHKIWIKCTDVNFG